MQTLETLMEFRHAVEQEGIVLPFMFRSPITPEVMETEVKTYPGMRVVGVVFGNKQANPLYIICTDDTYEDVLHKTKNLFQATMRQG